ncbi:MAG TPA: hypothetical protein VFS05_04285, partial [Gemmatimonadaceae bacterium]|nr:hypothetical protein [Gemmatimonadaceae bacterium]
PDLGAPARRELDARLRAMPGVRDVEMNPRTGSILVRTDGAAVSPDELLRTVTRRTPVAPRGARTRRRATRGATRRATAGARGDARGGTPRGSRRAPTRGARAGGATSAARIAASAAAIGPALPVVRPVVARTIGPNAAALIALLPSLLALLPGILSLAHALFGAATPLGFANAGLEAVKLFGEVQALRAA